MSYRNRTNEVAATNQHQTTSQPNEWELRAHRKYSMIREYMRQFTEMSSIWREAVGGNYSSELYSFVYSVADVQAQLIVDEKNIGWNGCEIFGYGTKITEDMKRQFFAKQRQQAEMGQIDVPIPVDRIHAWKKSASLRPEQKVAA